MIYNLEFFLISTCPVVWAIIVILIFALGFSLKMKRHFYFSTLFDAYKYYLKSPLAAFYIGLIFFATIFLIFGLFFFIFAIFNALALGYINPAIMYAGLPGLIISVPIYIILILKYRRIDEQFINNPGWIYAIKRITILDNNVIRKKTFGYLRNLRLLVGWTTITAAVLMAWGLLELLIPVITEGYIFGNGAESIYFSISLFKIIIGLILLLGVKVLMLNPMDTNNFWDKILQDGGYNAI